MARDDGAKLRGLAAEVGFTPVKMPNRDTWRLIDHATGKPAINPAIEAEGFETASAIRYLQKLKRKRSQNQTVQVSAPLRMRRTLRRS